MVYDEKSNNKIIWIRELDAIISNNTISNIDKHIAMSSHFLFK